MNLATISYHDPACSGCPACSQDMASILDDAVHNRFQQLAQRLKSLRTGVFRAIGSQRPEAIAARQAAAARRATQAPLPVSNEEFNSKFRKPNPRADAVSDGLSRGRSAPSPSTPSTGKPQVTYAPAPPDLGDAIRQHRKGAKS